MFRCGRGLRGIDNYGVAPFAIVARRPLEAYIGSRIVAEVRSRRVEEGYGSRDAMLFETERRIVSERLMGGMESFAACHVAGTVGSPSSVPDVARSMYGRVVVYVV